MNKETKQKETNVYVPEMEQEVINYKYADAVITCKSCGKDTKINHPGFINVETGIQFPPLKTDDRHFIALACEHCNAALTLRFIDAVTPPAHDFSHKGFELEPEIELTWKAGNNIKEFVVAISELPKEQVEGFKPEFEEVARVIEPKYNISLKEGSEYNLRIDTVYNTTGENGEELTETIPSQVLFLTSNPYPENTDNEEENKSEE
jgi:hypothetical protein